jgi:hypothetical protein
MASPVPIGQPCASKFNLYVCACKLKSYCINIYTQISHLYRTHNTQYHVQTQSISMCVRVCGCGCDLDIDMDVYIYDSERGYECLRMYDGTYAKYSRQELPIDHMHTIVY